MATEQSIKTPTELQAISYMTCTTNSGEGHCNKPGCHSYPIGCYLYRLTTASSNPTITFYSWDATISSTLRRATLGWVRGFTFIHVLLYIVSLHTAKCFFANRQDFFKSILLPSIVYPYMVASLIFLFIVFLRP